MTSNQFGPDVPYETLNEKFSACLPPNAPTPECDRIVGSLQSRGGFCGASPYSKMTYCACVNNKIPCAMIAASACANSAFAYRPTSMLPGGAAYDVCKNANICVNLAEVGGQENLVSGLVQQCGTIQNFTNMLTANPALAIFAFILLVALIVLVVSMPEAPAPGTPSRSSKEE